MNLSSGLISAAAPTMMTAGQLIRVRHADVPYPNQLRLPSPAAKRSAALVTRAKRNELTQLMTYACDSKLPSEEILFQDAETRTVIRRKDFTRVVGNSGVPTTICDLYIKHINKSYLQANNNGHFKKFIFPTTLAHIEIIEGDRKKDEKDYLTQVKAYLSTFKYLPKGKLDANKCDLWCIPISYEGHATAIVINIKEACCEFLNSGRCGSELELLRMISLCRRISKFVTVYVNSTRKGKNKINFSKFEWRFPRVPLQPIGSKACAIYMLRFLEEWDGGGRMDLRKFNGWKKESWHVNQRLKMWASLLAEDNNVVRDEVKRRARQNWKTISRNRKLRDLMGTKSMSTVGGGGDDKAGQQDQKETKL